MAVFSEHGRARRTDPETSHYSAAKLKASKLEMDILRSFRGAKKGLTIKEVTSRVDYPEISVSPRLRPMTRNGLVYPTMFRRVNPETGRPAIVWALTLFGGRVLRELP